MAVGGYQILSFQGKQFHHQNPGNATIPGIHAIIANSKKPLLLDDFYVNKVKAKPEFVQPAKQADGSYIIDYYTGVGTGNIPEYTITVDSNDYVTTTPVVE